MTRKAILLAAAMTCMAASVSAQFVAEKNNGETVKMGGNNLTITQKGDADEWTIGGTDISDIKSISITPLSERLGNYSAPDYADYYRAISSWEQRDKWNLANVHDPSVVRADDGYYYMYTTDASFGNVHHGHGHFMCRRSRNLVDWEFMGTTMPSLPSWVEPKLNEIRAAMGLGKSTADFGDDTQFGFWAPCVRKVKSGLYRMYYAITCPGTIDGDGTWTERAFIGLMETATPGDVNSWVDKGYVVTNASDRGLNYHVKADNWAQCYFKWNAIDPSYIITPEGEHWLIYGSWHSGFAALQIDPDTGKPQKEQGNPWGGDISAYGQMVSTRQMGNRWQASEAPEVVYHDGYYYLFMAYDELSVAYNTRVVRSRNITGPYVGIDGTDVTNRGGEAYPIVTHPYSFSESCGWVGISHCAVFDDGEGNWFYSSQGRLPANVYGDAYSNAIMMGQVRRLIWTEEGWPVVLPECYGAVPQAAIDESELVGQWENIALDYGYQHQDVATAITLRADHTVGGAPMDGQRWTFDARGNVLTVGSTKLYVAREADWETAPRRATLVYAGLDGKRTLWGKKSQKHTTYGATDNTAAFWTAFSPYYRADSGDCTFHFDFTNHTDRAEAWNNWILVITNGKERAAKDYKEYAVIRADAYGWGDFANDAQRKAGMANDYDWTTFNDDMDGAKVDLTLGIKDGKMDMTAITTTAAGKTFTYTYTVSGLPAGAKGAFLTMEKAHLVLNTDGCYMN